MQKEFSIFAETEFTALVLDMMNQDLHSNLYKNFHRKELGTLSSLTDYMFSISNMKLFYHLIK
jgi:hypothetical protein